MSWTSYTYIYIFSVPLLFSSFVILLSGEAFLVGLYFYWYIVNHFWQSILLLIWLARYLSLICKFSSLQISNFIMMWPYCNCTIWNFIMIFPYFAGTYSKLYNDISILCWYLFKTLQWYVRSVKVLFSNYNDVFVHIVVL